MQQWMCATVVTPDNPLHVVLATNECAVVSITTCAKPVPVAPSTSGERLVAYVIIAARTGDTGNMLTAAASSRNDIRDLLILLILEVRRMDISHLSTSSPPRIGVKVCAAR